MSESELNPMNIHSFLVILVFMAYFETRHEFTPKPQWKSLLCCMFLVCYGLNWLITNNLLVNTLNMHSLSSLFVVGGLWLPDILPR